MLEKKDYIKWHKIKAIEHNSSLKKDAGITYKEGRIYWTSVGQNIGYEEDGKGHLFTRPVLIVRGYNKRIFLGIPLTTKNKANQFHYSFKIKNSATVSTAILSQIRTFDTARIHDHHPMGSVDASTLRKIKDSLKELIG